MFGKALPVRVIDRHYGLDWLRIGAFMLLILHHIGRAFASGDWLVKLDELEWLAAPMLFVTPWRLALLFLIAGFASRAMLSRLATGAFARERTLRLLLPLLAAMILVIPPQSYVNLAFNHVYGAGFLHFLTHDAFAFRAVDGVAQPGWEHLWFVFYLWAYTMLLAGGIMAAPAALKARLSGWTERLLEGRRLLWLPLLYFIPARIAVAFTLGESHGLFDDWVSDVIYLPCFLIGFALAGSAGLWPAVARCWRPALAVAAASYALLLPIELSYPGEAMPPHVLMAVDRAAMAAMMWGTLLVLLRVADTWLNRDHASRAPLSEAVFPFYIIHQTIIVVLAWALIPQGLSSGAAFVVLLCGTISGCWLFYRLGDLVPALRPLIGLKPRPPASARRSAGAPVKLGA
jgi:glucans biosynthesis protein C